MTLKLITPAAEEPIDATQFEAHLHGVSEADDSGDLGIKLRAAREYIENAELHGRALITSTWRLYLEHWPCGRKPIEVPLGNLQSVASIIYTDASGVRNTWPSTQYKVYRTYTPADAEAVPPVVGDGTTDAGIGAICPAYSYTWPTALLDVGEPIEIEFTCGWDSAANVPFPLKAALLLVASTLYRNRESVFLGRAEMAAALKLSGDADAVISLCAPYADRRY